MSLINQMLRDLDARKAGECARAKLPSAVTPLAARVERKRYLPWFASIAALGLIVLAAWFWHGMRQPVTNPDPTPSVAPVATLHPVVPDLPPLVAAKVSAAPKALAYHSPHVPRDINASADQPALALRKEVTLHMPSASPAPTASGLSSASRNDLPAQPLPSLAESHIKKTATPAHIG